MNPREKNLVYVLAGVLVFGLSLLGGYRWFWTPLKDYNAKIKSLEDEKDLVDTQFAIFQIERQKLPVARRKSLPANQELASGVYQEYLANILSASGLRYEEISHSVAQEVKVVAPLPNVKKTGHRTMTFTIRAHGELGQLVNFMERLQRTPYEHRIKTLNIDRGADVKRLGIHIVVETLLVAGTKSAGEGPPTDIKVAMPEREYSLIAKKNIFIGAEPPPPPPPKKKKIVEEKKEDPEPEPEPEPEPDINVPRYVRLIQTVPNQQTAFLRNLIQKSREIKLIAKERSGFEFFRIVDDESDYEFFKAKVLRVDARTLYFQVKDQVFGVAIGESLAEAMEFPLSIERRDELDLIDLFDREWAAEQTADKKKSSSKTSKKTSKKR